jgi:hypothetical protein
MPLDDPAAVREQYATEDRLRARQSLYAETPGQHPHDVLWVRELRDLIAYPRELVETFSRENGELFLRKRFARVETRDVDGIVTVRDRAALVAYRDSLSLETAPVPDDVALPFRVHRRSSVFLARKAR